MYNTNQLTVSRTLLQIAKLGHLWTGRGIRSGSRKLVRNLLKINRRDAEFLRTAYALLEDDIDGPSMQDILKLEPRDQSALFLAPLATRTLIQTQQWLAWVTASYGLDLEEMEESLQETEV